MNKKSTMDINNCDILNENGVLRLVYNSDKYAYPLTLAKAKSYHELNEDGMRLFDAEDWVDYIVSLAIGEENHILSGLLADIYQNHHDLYEDVFLGGTNNDDKDTPDCDGCADDEDYDCDNCCDGDDVVGTLTLTDTGRVNEKGHRIGHFDLDSLIELDEDILRILAESCDIADVDGKSNNCLIWELHQQDIDIDDNEDCDDCSDNDDADDCDGDCENCEYAELDDRDEESDEDDSRTCEEDEHPDWPHPIEDDTISNTDAQSEAPQYEYVNGPAHYHGTECIENMRKLYGDEAVRWFCILSAYKYRFRDGSKPGVSAEQDHEKAHWYENYAVKMMGEQRYY